MNIEESFLALLLKPENMREIFSRGIPEGIFVHPKNREIFNYIMSCYSHYGAPPSREILIEKFNFDPPEVVDSAENIANFLIERYLKNNIHEILLSAADRLNQDPAKALNFLHEKTIKLRIETSDKRRRYDYVANSLARIREYENRNKNPERGCPTGWPLFDEWTLGLQRGELGILFAGTGKGKTYTMLRMAIGAYAHGWNPLIISFEPTIKSLYTRLDSIVARINPKRYRAGELTEEEFQRLRKRLELLQTQKRPFVIVKPINNHPNTIVESIYENRMGEDEKWVVFVDQMSFFSSRGERFEYYKNLFLDICQIISPNNLNVPCWVLAQENREGMRAEKAHLTNIALSSFTEQFADLVLNLYRDDYDSCTAILRILKFREGKPAEFSMEFDLDRGIIEVVGIISA